ncbi:antibiotic biosynthesis monooxygenase [uncultured Amnibacterium sp.]|uniref:antibiotic biosynthesis monooxygenase n=1 Tax=uncultured Amnibacterium sp. TaxID=1631851 RepID=UPI0035CAA213
MSVAEPVTVSITRRVPPERAKEAQAWLRSGQDLVAAMPGYLGSGWVRSEPDGEEWHMLYRFADGESLARWERSPQREWWVASAVGIAEDAWSERRTGIEGWFDSRARAAITAPRPPSPPRWKQMVSIFLVFYPLSLSIQLVLGGWLVTLEPWLRVLVTVAVASPLMTYLLLPLVTRALRPWLLRTR